MTAVKGFSIQWVRETRRLVGRSRIIIGVTGLVGRLKLIFVGGCYDRR